MKMDFQFALNQILSELDKNQIEYGLIGGFALGILGVNRATSDIDILIKNSEKEIVRELMGKLNYDSIFTSNSFSLFQSPLKLLGEIDFLHPDSNTISEILLRKSLYSLFDSNLKAYVIHPEDLIILKLQAIKLDNSRKEKDESDILYLLNLYSKEIDIERILHFSKKMDMESYFISLNGKVQNE
jgi:predicted nucleotidyltransferase